MGNRLFGVDIAGIVAAKIGPGVLAATITRRASTGARQAGNLTGGLVKAGPQSWLCRGFWEDFTGTPPGIELELNDRKAVLIGNTIPRDALPLQKNDEITIEGLTLFVVKQLSRDPAAAVFTLLCRDRASANAA